MANPLASPVLHSLLWLTAGPIGSVWIGGFVGFVLFHLFGGFRGTGMDASIPAWMGLGFGALAGLGGVFASLFCALASLRGTIDRDQDPTGTSSQH